MARNALPYSASLAGYGTRHGTMTECLVWASRESSLKGFVPGILRVRHEGDEVFATQVDRNEERVGLEIALMLAEQKARAA